MNTVWGSTTKYSLGESREGLEKSECQVKN